MALFINVDPVPASWWKRKVHRGWQFGYSGGTENDFIIDIEIAKWRFACYIGFKKVQNWAPGYEKHLKWRKEQERARQPKPAGLKSFFRRWRTSSAADRVDQKRTVHDVSFAYAKLLLAAKRFIRFSKPSVDRDNKGRKQLAAWDGIPESVRRDAAASFERKLLHPEHQRQTSDDDNPKEAEARRLPKEPYA